MRKMKCSECGKKYKDCISEDAKSIVCPECAMRLDEITKERKYNKTTMDWLRNVEKRNARIYGISIQEPKSTFLT